MRALVTTVLAILCAPVACLASQSSCVDLLFAKPGAYVCAVQFDASPFVGGVAFGVSNPGEFFDGDLDGHALRCTCLYKGNVKHFAFHTSKEFECVSSDGSGISIRGVIAAADGDKISKLFVLYGSDDASAFGFCARSS